MVQAAHAAVDGEPTVGRGSAQGGELVQDSGVERASGLTGDDRHAQHRDIGWHVGGAGLR